MILNLDQKFKPISGAEISFESFIFNGGEPHIRISNFDIADPVYITHRINSFNDLGLLCVAVDALKRMGAKKLHLYAPYFPGARQDRVMVEGESLTVKVYADLINRLELESITIIDPHSDVTPALLNNCMIIQNHQFIKQVLEHLPKDIILISPDAGASKKIFKLATALGIPNVIECGKKRDLASGQLSGFSVPIEDMGDKSCLIVDDICDGGGTFLGLGEALRQKNSGDLYLAVTHGIFSKGFADLSKIFHHIYTTNSVKDIDSTEYVTQISHRHGSVS